MLDRSLELLRFGPFELDARSGELRRDGSVVPVARQPFKLLAALVARPGEVVTRDELRRSIWGDETFVDFERGLNFCVLQARAALGDDARNPVYIETLPKRGYRFVAPVNTGRPMEPLQQSRPRWHVAFVAVAVTLILLTAWQQRATPASAQRLAVLPFENLSSNGNSHFADGMREEVVTHLSRLAPAELHLIARASVERYRGTAASVADIGRALGVQHVVTGTVRHEGERARVTAQLIETATETQIWAESFDRDGAAVLAIQQEIAEKIARALELRLIDGRDARVTARSQAAHDAYLRGRQLVHGGKLEESVRWMREAIRLEPDYVMPHIGLAESIHAMAMSSRMPAVLAAEEIRRATVTAERLAPRLAQTHAARAMLAFWYDWQLDEAEESYREAIRLNPSEPGALHDHGWLLIVRGRFEAGIAEIRRAQALDPLSARANTHVAWAYIYSRRYRDAEREAQRARALQPGFREAEACVHQVSLLEGRTPPKEAVDPRNPYGTAARLAMRGDGERALQWLARARDARDTQFILVGADPKFERLHGDPRFIELLRASGLEPVRPPA